ncbi:hypothetical protein N7447_007862 [Penicillium robsamsonii]|uniref:uncharacterized protein n=1 Tax=Penicillium robsamsonii TaxID=1792511 RepID=UPI0025488E8F|nr:uncharacterized protein N7447_007862 [Penicillium robsamsonii]KAJ5817854.1 hypothetical protein N7447_007862 [Penicillium robsamsonii]
MSLPGVEPQGGGESSSPRGSHSNQHQFTPTATLPPNSRRSSEEITQEELDRKPWKYIALQDNIACLEGELEDIDRFYSRQEVPDENNGSFRHDTRQERVKCLWKIKDALEKYSVQYPSIIYLRLKSKR